MVFDYYIPELYKSVIDYKNSEDCLFIEAEQKILDTDHCKIGALVCENWKLPADICFTIKSHHDLVDIDSAICFTDVMKLSDITSHGLGYSTIDNSIMPMNDDSIFQKQGLDISLIENNLSIIEAITESYLNNNA